MASFEEKAQLIEAQNGRVTEIKLTLVIEKASGTVGVTDIMLQGGSIGTMWNGHPSELRWTVDG